MTKKKLSEAIEGRDLPPGLRRGQDLQVGEPTTDKTSEKEIPQSAPSAIMQSGESTNIQNLETAILSERKEGTTQIDKEPVSQIRKEETMQIKEPAQTDEHDEALSQSPTTAIMPVSTFTEEQLRQLAEMVASNMIITQTSKKEKVKKVDLQELLLQAIASSEVSDNLRSQLEHIAKAQKAKINQGVFAPEALFTLYRNASLQISLNGKKVSAGDLMAQALIAYIPQLMRDWVESANNQE